MRKYIAVVLLFAFASMAKGISQENNENRDRGAEMKALQIAFITDKLSLTPEEAQMFWPIHTAFEESGRSIRAEARRNENIDELSDAEAMAIVQSRLDADEKMLTLRKKYVEDLKPILPPKKIAQLFSIEHEFKRKMLKNIREKRKEKRKMNKG